jgi:dTDP-4-dehydrorhamnose reductase
MRLLILGGGGMLGHKLWQTAAPRFEAWATMRDGRDVPPSAIPDPGRLLAGVRAEEFDTVVRAFATVRPEVVVNCIGVVKQRREAKDPITSLTVNSLFPHRLAALCAAAGARLVHISTDCVFAGTAGRYRETDPPDATDLYGRSKQLGEVSGPGAVTLRTSIIGREINSSQGLVEWFMAQQGIAPGFTRAVFSGLTTLELSRVIVEVVTGHPALEGIYHVASEPIAKYDLLILLNEAFGRGLDIQRDDTVSIDRSLDGAAFAAATGCRAPAWPVMIGEMAADRTPYETWRAVRGR